MKNTATIESLKPVTRFIICGIVLFVLLITWYYGRHFFWVEALFVVEVFVVTLLTRSTAASRGALVYVSSIAIAVGGTALLFTLLRIVQIPMDNAFMSGFVIGPVEEVLKIVPVILAAYILYKRHAMCLNLSDWLWLSTLSGAAFSMMEKVFWQGVRFPFTYGPHIGDWYFFPDALGIYVDGDEFGYVGHAAATAMVGMAIGAGLLIKKKKTAMHAVWWLVPAVVFAWVTLEHAFVNGFFANGSDRWAILGGGQITPYICLLMIIAAVTLDLILHMKLAKQYPHIKKNVHSGLRFFLQGVKEKKWESITVLGNVNRYIRAVNQAALQQCCTSKSKQPNQQTND